MPILSLMAYLNYAVPLQNQLNEARTFLIKSKMPTPKTSCFLYKMYKTSIYIPSNLRLCRN